jgi:hypothetical protein
MLFYISIRNNWPEFWYGLNPGKVTSVFMIGFI